MSGTLGPESHSRVRRMPELATYDETSIFEILDAAPFCHLAVVIDGRAVSIPTMHARAGRTLFLHGSRSNAALTQLLAAGNGSLSAATFDGVRLARSGFETSLAYRSVVAFGSVTEVDLDRQPEVLQLFVDRLSPGRSEEVRPVSDRERRLTQVVAFEIVEASAKISSGPTTDDADDAAQEIWSGVVPAAWQFYAPIPARDGAMADDTVLISRSVREMMAPSNEDLVTALGREIDRIDPVDQREESSLAALRNRLRWPGDLFENRINPYHLTASAFVISSRGVVLLRHRILGLWVQPGGHVDSDETLLEAAMREVLEETGLPSSPLRDGALYHVDVHPGPRGHTHFDLRYLLWSDGREVAPSEGESADVFWFPLASARERAEPSLDAVLQKIAGEGEFADVRH